MKKLLAIFGAMGMVATTGATVVACGDKNTEEMTLDQMVELFNKNEVRMQELFSVVMDEEGVIDRDQKKWDELYLLQFQQFELSYLISQLDPENEIAEGAPKNKEELVEWFNEFKELFLAGGEDGDFPLPSESVVKEMDNLIKKYS